MSVSLSLIGGAGWQFFDDNGTPLAGGKIYTYAAGTTTPLATYTDYTGGTPNTNPIILDAAGRTPNEVWATDDTSYKYVIKTSDDVLIRTWDNILTTSLGNELASTTDNSLGDALVGFRQSSSSGFLSGSVGSTVHSKLQEFISVRDFGAVGDNATDDTTAFQNAITACQTLNKVLFVPAGTYLISSPLTFTCSVRGEGMRAAIIRASGSALSTIDYAFNIGTVGSVTRRLMVSDIFFLGNNTTGSAYNGLSFSATWWSHYQNIRVEGFYGTGVRVSRQSYWNVFTNIECGRDNETGTYVAPNVGLLLDGVSGAGVTASTFTNISVTGRTYGVNMSYGDCLVFNMLEVTGSATGLNCQATNTAIVINAFYAELCTTAAIANATFGLQVNGIAYTGTTTLYTGTQPAIAIRPGTPNRSWSLSTLDLTSAWAFTYTDSGDYDLTITNTRSGVQPFKLDQTVLSVNGSTGAALATQTYHQFYNGAGLGDKVVTIASALGGDIIEFDSVQAGSTTAGANAANAAVKVGNPVGNRSINASGTINANGADYAEYMMKDGDFTLNKGDVAGVNADGLLTLDFARAVAFVVKSTDPSFVGNDAWGKGLSPEEFEAKRALVDRIAFCGQVPVNVFDASPGDYIIPCASDGKIAAKPVANPSFDEYRMAIGRVVAIETDGRARIIVKIA